jgi:uncharacterized protein YndB with AHSA1/START domain
MSTQTIPAVRRSVTVNAPLARTFEVFTASMIAWWPTTHRIGDGELAEIVMEPREGGRWYERNTAGAECDWGRVLAFQPPERLLLAWQLDNEWRFVPDPARASEVEVTFTAEEPGRTRVDLVHRGFGRLGDDGQEVADAVASDGGWDLLLNLLATHLKEG